MQTFLYITLSAILSLLVIMFQVVGFGLGLYVCYYLYKRFGEPQIKTLKKGE